MQTIQLSPSPNQTLTIVLSSQLCELSVYTKAGNLYMDVLVNNAPVIVGVLCLNNNKIVRELYRGFVGDFSFVDTQGANDPTYDGLGSRYQLAYLTPSDLAA